MMHRTTSLGAAGERHAVQVPIIVAPSVRPSTAHAVTFRRPPERIRIEVDAGEHPVADARRAVRQNCGRVPADVVDDLQLIVSELVTNVLEHGDGASGLAVELSIGTDEVDLRVTGHGDRRLLPPSSEWELPPSSQPAGRGLALVRRLASRVTVGGNAPTPDEPGWVSISASLALPA